MASQATGSPKAMAASPILGSSKGERSMGRKALKQSSAGWLRAATTPSGMARRSHVATKAMTAPAVTMPRIECPMAHIS